MYMCVCVISPTFTAITFFVCVCFESVVTMQKLVAREILAFFIWSVFFYTFKIVACCCLWCATSIRIGNHLQRGKDFLVSALVS